MNYEAVPGPVGKALRLAGYTGSYANDELRTTQTNLIFEYMWS